MTALTANEHITIPLLIIAILLLIACTIWHFIQHFQLQSCFVPSASMEINRVRSSSIRSASNSIISALENKRSPCRCICIPPDGEEFDFFPMAFLIYLVFLITVCITILTRLLLINTNLNSYFTDQQQINSEIDYIHMPSITSLHSVTFSEHNPSQRSAILTLDWILVYFIMLISLIESLFSWYRYHTTLMTTKYLQLLTATDIIKKYSFYGILFTVFYIVTMHFYFYLFPLVIILHSAFNLFCNFKFSSLLISSYSMFIDRDAKFTTNDTNKDILNSVYFMKRASLTCTIIQSTYLCIFIFVYNINIIVYLPILWSISSAVFTLNFIRNRQPISQYCMRCKLQLLHTNNTKQNESYALDIVPSIKPSINNLKDSTSETKYKKVAFNVTTPKSTAQRKQKALEILGVDALNPLNTHNRVQSVGVGFKFNLRINKRLEKIDRNPCQPDTPLSAPAPFPVRRKTQHKTRPLTPSKLLDSIRNAVEFPFESKKHMETEDDANVSWLKPTLLDQKMSVSNPIHNYKPIDINPKDHLTLKNSCSAPIIYKRVNPSMNECVKQELDAVLPLQSTNLRINNTQANNINHSSFESVTIGSVTHNALSEINSNICIEDYIQNGNEFSGEYNSEFELNENEFSIQTEDNEIGKEFEKHIGKHMEHDSIPNVTLKIPHFVSTLQNTAHNAETGDIGNIEMEMRRKSFDPNYVVQKLNIYLQLLKSLGVCSSRTVNNAKQLQAYHHNIHKSQSKSNVSQLHELNPIVKPNFNVNYTGSTHL